MMDLSICHESGEELEKQLRLKTFPLAIKFLEKKDDIPEGAERPLEISAVIYRLAKHISFHAVKGR